MFTAQPQASDSTHTQPRYASVPFQIALALAIVLLAAVFFRASNAPIWSVDTWGHWKYGQWISEHNLHIPPKDPFSRYTDAEGPLLDSWWLSQVLCYRIYAASGIEGIALCYALIEVVKTLLFLAALRRATGSLLLAVVGVALMYVGRWPYFGIFRPQAIGEVCWAALLFVAARPPWPKWGVVAAPLSVALWANLHGGFLLAFVLIGACLLNRVWTVMGGRLRFSAVAEDAEVQRLALTLILSLAATCLTPYGPRYVVEVIKFSRTPSLQMIGEWLPLTPLTTYASKALVVSLLFVLLMLRWSPRPFSLSDGILLLVFSLGGWFAARVIPFWMTVWPLVLAPHVLALLQQKGWERYVVDRSSTAAPGWLKAWHPLVPAGACALALLFFTATTSWLLGAPRPLQDRLREEIPEVVARDLCAPSQPGAARKPLRVFCSARWSDYLVWKLPAEDQVYWYTHWHCYTLQHINDGNYLLALHGPPHDWKAIVNRYRFNVLALLNTDKSESRGLFGYLLEQWGRPDSEWDVTVYTDNFSPGLLERSELSPDKIWGLMARSRVDPFALTMTGVQVVPNCLGGGTAAGVMDGSVLTHLPWIWPER